MVSKVISLYVLVSKKLVRHQPIKVFFLQHSPKFIIIFSIHDVMIKARRICRGATIKGADCEWVKHSTWQWLGHVISMNEKKL